MRSVILMAAMVVGVCAVADGRAQGWVDRTTATGPAPRAYHSMCYDPVRGYVMLAGGWGFQDPPQNPMRTEVWTWDGVSWTQRASTPFNDTRALVWHESTNQLIAIGATYSQTYSSVASIWDGATWSAPTALPFPVSSPVAGFDPIRQETIVYSGSSPLEVAVWNGASWASRPVVVPASISYPSLALDPSVNRLVLAGHANNGTPRFFEWSGFGWNQRLPAQAPTWPGSLATDSLRQRVILFDGDYDNLQPNHTWTLRNGTLTRLTTPVEPTLRRYAAMAFDPVRGKCVLFGGVSGSNFYLGDTWEFDLGPVASFGTFGSGCSGSRGVPSLTALSNSVPRVGGTFQARVSNLPWSGPAFLALGLSNTSYATTPLPADLGFLGAPGCSLLTSIEEVQPLVNVLGTATWSFPVPPLAGLPFYTQVLPLDPSANLLGFSASNGGVGVIGL